MPAFALPDRAASRWALLILLSALLAGLLAWIGLPAGLLLGPMIAGILLATRGAGVTVPPRLFVAAQAMVGCLIASAITSGIVATLLRDWPLFLGVTVATLAASSTLGYLLSRWQVLPGTAAVWGSTPGAATAMVLMAQAFGADARLVAVMTYTRVVCVAGTASLLAAIVTGHGGGHPGTGWLAMPDPLGLAVTIAVAAVGATGARLLRVPAGGLIGPLALGAVLNATGTVRLVLPEALLAVAYAVVGWRIGLNFTRETVAVAARAMPRILLAAMLLIALCAGLGLLLSWRLGVDPVTAYLATSPGGMDSVAIIAASSPVDVPFVMALQVVRFVAVILVGPALASAVARRQGLIRTPG